MKEYYGFLMRFVGTECSRSHLLHHHYTQKEIDECIKLGYIREVRKQDDGEPVYGITRAGKSYRDD